MAMNKYFNNRVNKSFDRLSTNGYFLIQFVLSLSNRERSSLIEEAQP